MGDETYTVVRGEAAALLVNSRYNRFILPFVARERGVGEVAALLGVGKSLVSYWVGRLRRLGLLVPASGARGRYRSSGDAFEAALEDLPMETLEDILAAQLDPFYGQLKRTLLRVGVRHGQRWRYRVARRPQGVYESIEPVEGTLEQARIVNLRASLSLTSEQAMQLRDDLQALHERYGALSQPAEPGRREVLCWVAAVDAG